jgi:GNAT-family acetyltransferase (TIGR03103 family)
MTTTAKSGSTTPHSGAGTGVAEASVKRDVVVDCGWGRLLFGQTFDSNDKLMRAIRAEEPGRRDIAMYLREPHVVLSLSPQALFLDPSHTYRLPFERYEPDTRRPQGFVIRAFESLEEVREANRIWQQRGMVPSKESFVMAQTSSNVLTYLVAIQEDTNAVLGVVMGVDHVEAFGDPSGGTSLWALAVDPQTALPGVGTALVRALIEQYVSLGRHHLDLSVMHDNSEAIALYHQLGFDRVDVFCVKKKNPINETLFVSPESAVKLNPYADIIIEEAHRRGIAVQVLDQDAAYFQLSHGGRTVTCRESLSELTTAIAMSRCQDKRVTRRILSRVGLSAPDQMSAGDPRDNLAFLAKHKRIVVKPANGEQGAGVSVDIRTAKGLDDAIELAGRQDAILEEMVRGEDLRVIVIDHECVAAAVRRTPFVVGTGKHTVRELIEKQSRRREAATQGESRIPIDDETIRCITDAGCELGSVLPAEAKVVVRKAANLHTGGTIHDVTDSLHPALAKACIEASHALDIPVVGFDLIVPSVAEPEYHIIEANERPGLANHEPSPTAERFLDLLFPRTAPNLERAARKP